ncbi:flagellar protein FliS [Vibrio hepatarius]|uniref:flagellar protein FliS n=1 Tax=Vibrio hepatarius TaxID=171383 RepID=UPI001C0A3EC1|nr:flagellar protein FliS [Vibrio hepatarius]MBU2895959.1 flagellar protein FliS [Vibrio hepatarius]
MKNIKRFRRTKTNELAGMSKHALMMRMYKEMYKLLDKCEYVMKNRTQYSPSEFFSVKAKCLGKVISISSCLADTTDMSADKEIGELFVKMYSYIYVNSSEANKKIDIDYVIRAKNMSYKLIDVWDSIPESSRY